MILEFDVNLLEHPLNGFLHQANCYHTMGSGIAFAIKRKYPELYQADVDFGGIGDITKLGKFSTAQLHDGKRGYNMYSQFGFGGDRRATNYEAVYDGLEAIKEHATNNNILKLGLPKNMGAALGGGSWRVIRAMIDDIFNDWENELHICNYTPPVDVRMNYYPPKV